MQKVLSLSSCRQGGSPPPPQARVGGAAKLLDWFHWESQCAAREAGPCWTPVRLPPPHHQSWRLSAAERGTPGRPPPYPLSSFSSARVGCWQKTAWGAACGVQLSHRPGWVLKGTSRPMFPILWQLCRRSGERSGHLHPTFTWARGRGRTFFGGGVVAPGRSALLGPWGLPWVILAGKSVGRRAAEPRKQPGTDPSCS